MAEGCRPVSFRGRKVRSCVVRVNVAARAPLAESRLAGNDETRATLVLSPPIRADPSPSTDCPRRPHSIGSTRLVYLLRPIHPPPPLSVDVVTPSRATEATLGRVRGIPGRSSGVVPRFPVICLFPVTHEQRLSAHTKYPPAIGLVSSAGGNPSGGAATISEKEAAQHLYSGHYGSLGPI